MLSQDVVAGRAACEGLGIPGWEDPLVFESLSLVLTYRSPLALMALGGRMSTEDRAAMRKRFKDKVSAGSIQAFLEGPRGHHPTVRYSTASHDTAITGHEQRDRTREATARRPEAMDALLQ